MSELFVKIDNIEKGPFSKKELHNLAMRGEFNQHDLVFHEDSQEWVEAGQIEDLYNVFERPEQLNTQKLVYAIGGGKGGVGKTSLTASLGIGLAALDNRVVIVDADLGGANLHTAMGILDPEYTFYHFYTMQRESLNDILLDTPIKNLKLISGACGTLGLANPQYAQKQRFIHQLHRLNADFILLDLGAGSSYHVIDFFIAADQGVLVTTPDPIAIQDTFNFLKVSLMRRLIREFKNKPRVLDILESHTGTNQGRMLHSMFEIIKQIREIDSDVAASIENFISGYKPKLILNMVHTEEEIKEGDTFKTAAYELLGVDVEYIGYIDYDESVRQSVKELRPFILDNPRSKASKSLARLISVGILGREGFKGFREKLKVMRHVRLDSKEYPKANLKDSDTICSVKCIYWDDCEYQNGGHPCSVRHLDPIFKK